MGELSDDLKIMHPTLQDYTDLDHGTEGNEVQNSDTIHAAYEEHEMDEEMSNFESTQSQVEETKEEFERMDTDKTPVFSFSETYGTRETPETDNSFHADMSDSDSPISVSQLCVSKCE